MSRTERKRLNARRLLLMNKSGEKSISSYVKVCSVIKILFPTAAKKFPFFFLLEALKTLTGIIQPFVAVLISPLIVDELIGDKDLHKLITYAAALILAEFILTTADALIGNSLGKYQERLDNYFNMLLGERTMQLDFPLTEKKEVLDQLEKAKEGIAWYSGGAYGIAEQLFGLIKNVVSLTGFVTIIVLRAPLLLAVISVYCVIRTLIGIRLNRIDIQAYDGLSRENRLFGYFAWNVVDPRYGKDIRLYEAQDMMVEAWEQSSEKTRAHWKWMADTAFPYHIVQDILAILRSIFAYFYIALLAMRGVFSIGIFTQLIAAEGSLTRALSALIVNITDLIKRSNYAYEYVLFMEITSAMPKGEAKVERSPHEIEFKNVSFAYPGSERRVLENVNLKIRAGEHLALVGRNGAGKTTFIKLLCRLYDPTEGAILLDGRDIREYDYSQYMEQFAPVFQDFQLFAMSIKENIVFEKDDASLDELISSVGLTDMIESLEKNTDTQLMKFFDESGIEPSGGEQQKIAIARALFKDSPVVILDEPTSALDPLAEYEIYKQFHTLVGNRTAFYISHRLSSCRFCDHIAVFDKGRIKEYGDHDSLVAKENGLYAEMFDAQAKYYKE